jgi:hypothetical protein
MVSTFVFVSWSLGHYNELGRTGMLIVSLSSTEEREKDGEVFKVNCIIAKGEQGNEKEKWRRHVRKRRQISLHKNVIFAILWKYSEPLHCFLLKGHF